MTCDRPRFVPRNHAPESGEAMGKGFGRLGAAGSVKMGPRVPRC
jgi:hypothetical protein